MVEYIGIDIGGTNIRVGAINEKEELIFEYKDVTTSEDLYKKIKNLVLKVPNYQDAKAIGIGVPGSVDAKTKKIVTSKNVSVLKEINLVERLSKELNKQVFIENDARVAALAEALKGRGKDKETVCYIRISTGLGGGVVINNKIYSGYNNLGAYFSRMILDGNDVSDYLISGTALIRMTKEKLGIDIKATSELFELAKNENKIAVEIADNFKHNLVVLLLNISSTFNPDIIILGGGVMESKKYFLDEVKKAFGSKAHPLAKNTLIDVAEFKEPGIIGACLLAKINNKGT